MADKPDETTKPFIMSENTEVLRAQPTRLKGFQPGSEWLATGGNPGGRPVGGKFVTQAYNKIGLMSDKQFAEWKLTDLTQFERRAIAMFEAKGRELVPAMKEVTDRTEGRVDSAAGTPSVGIQIVLLDEWAHSKETFECTVSENKLLEAKDLDEE
jgi:hypothetical protein